MSFIAALLVGAAFVVSAGAQTPRQAKPEPGQSAARSSPAFAELQLRKTELESELEALLLDYTEEFPRVAALRIEAGLLNKEVERVLATPAAEAGKLTLALGKLMVKRAELQADVDQLLKNYKEDYPDVKRARRKVEIYDKAIREILGN